MIEKAHQRAEGLEDRISVLEQRCKRRGEKLAQQAKHITRLEASRKTLRDIIISDRALKKRKN